MKNTDKQYNDFNKDYSENTHQNNIADNDFYLGIDTKKSYGKILDIGCGDGHDLIKFSNSELYGIDPSENFVNQIKTEHPNVNIKKAKGEKIPFESSYFDLVISKYAIQTSNNIPAILKESARVLKKGGKFYFLTKHPIQQFLEKKKFMNKPVNYFKQEITESVIYDGLITLREPTHSMEEYFNKEFFENFELIDYKENFDFPASEQIAGDIYPTYMLITARRK